jgi:cyclohexyl-isocyanide hydratase
LKVAFVIYEGMTSLDFIGVYDPITRLKTLNYIPELEWDIVAYTEEVVDGSGLRITPGKVREPLGAYDMVIVPGGFSSRRLTQDRGFMDWIRTAADCRLKVSVCTGSLILGEAGFLKGKRATSHFTAYQLLAKYCTVSEDRIVDEGDVITAGGVASSLDLGLYLCEKLAGAEAKEKIREAMCYLGER